MIHGKNHQPIKAQNLGSYGSKVPHAALNRHTRGSGTWQSNKETRGRPPKQRGANGAHLPVGRPPWSDEWARPPPTSSLYRIVPTGFLKSVLPTTCTQAMKLPL